MIYLVAGFALIMCGLALAAYVDHLEREDGE